MNLIWHAIYFISKFLTCSFSSLTRSVKFLLYKWLRVVYASHLRNVCFYGILMFFVGVLRCFSALLTIFTHMQISMPRKARPKLCTHCYWSVRVLSIVCHTFFNTYPFEGSYWRSSNLDLNSPPSACK